MTIANQAQALEETFQVSAKWWNWLLWPVLGSLLFFIVLWKLDFPAPHMDDLFYTGASINLVSGGDFSNPYLARQHPDFKTHYFFVYPPVHSYLLAGWLMIFGINTWSMTGFICAAMWLAAVSIAVVLKRNGAPVIFSWLAPLGFVFTLLPIGLRPEALSVALTLAGFALAGGSAKSLGRAFSGYLLMFFGGACAPRMTVFSAIFIVCALTEFWRKNRDNAEMRQMFLVVLLALITTVIAFLVMIDFRIMEFWRTFHLHSTRVSGKQIELIKEFIRSDLGFLQWPWLLLPLCMAFFCLRKNRDELTMAGTLLLVGLFLTILSGGLGKGTLFWMVMSTMFFAAVLVKAVSLKFFWTFAIQAAFAAMLLIGNRKFLVNIYGFASGNIVMHSDEKRNRELRELRPTPENPLLVDSAAARYVFDYKLPRNVLDLGFGARFPGGIPGDLSAEELRPGDIFMTGSATSSILAGRTYLPLTIPKWSLFGSERFQFDVFRRRVYVVSATDCKGPRPREGIPIWMPHGMN